MFCAGRRMLSTNALNRVVFRPDNRSAIRLCRQDVLRHRPFKYRLPTDWATGTCGSEYLSRLLGGRRLAGWPRRVSGLAEHGERRGTMRSKTLLTWLRAVSSCLPRKGSRYVLACLNSVDKL